MATDPRKVPRRRPPAWLPFALGNVSGALLMALIIWLVTSIGKPNPTPASAVTAHPSPAGAKPASPGINFEYEEELRSSEVPMPADATPALPHPPTATTRGEPQLMLQAGAFRSIAEAQKLEQRVNGLRLAPAVMRESHPSPTDTWYRVLVGPFASDASLRVVQDRLAEIGVQAFPVTIKPTPSTTPQIPGDVAPNIEAAPHVDDDAPTTGPAPTTAPPSAPTKVPTAVPTTTPAPHADPTAVRAA